MLIYFYGISHRDTLLFTKHLAMMTKAGLTLFSSLTILKNQARGTFRKILEDVLQMVNAGSTLADALAKHPSVFSLLLRSIVAVGESSGTLSENLRHLATHLEREHQFRNKIKAAMVYPVFVLAVATGVGFILATVVLPQITRVFRVLDAELPLVTRIVLTVAAFLQGHGWWFLPVSLAVILIVPIVLRQRWMAPLWHPALLALPVFGSLALNMNRMQFSRSLALLLVSGIPLAQALETISGMSPNVVFAKRIARVKDSVIRGQTLAVSLGQSSRLFPEVLSQMVEVGEKSGTLDQTLFTLADFYDEELDNTVRNLSVLIEPVLLVLIGAVVGTVALAILLPIWSVTSVIHG